VRPAKIVKVFTISATSILLLASIGAVLFVTFYPKENLLAFLTAQAEATLGRKVFVKKIGYSLGGVSLEGVKIFESDSEHSPVLLSSEYVGLGFSLFSILQLELDFDTLIVRNATCNIVFDAGGESNIQRLLTSMSKKKDSGLSVKISHISLSNAAITIENPPKFLAPLAGTYLVTGKIRIDKAIRINSCSITLPRSRGKISPELTVENLNNNFRITGSAGIENVSLLWVYQWGNTAALPYNYVNGKVANLVITRHFITGYTIATATLIDTNKLLSLEGTCHVDLDARSVYISQTAGSIENSTFFLEYLCFTLGGKLVRFNASKINASMSDLKPLLKFIPSKLFGTVEGYLTYADGLYNGNLSLGSFGWDPETKIISDLQTTLAISENIFNKTDIPFKLYASPCLLSIASTDRSLSKLFINVSSDAVSFDSAKNKFSSSDEPMNIPMRISGLININQLHCQSFKASGVQLNYELSGNTFIIKGFQFLYANGRVTGNGTIRIPQGSAQASLSLDFNNLQAQDIIYPNQKIRNKFFGIIQGNSKIEFELNDNILQTAKGNVEFTVDRGKLVDTGIQNGLGMFLSELKYKLRDLEFNKIYGNIDIKGNAYQIKSFIFNSNSIRLNITGNFDMNLNASPLNIGLEFTKGFIQDLPAPSQLVLNKYLQGEWYMIPFIMNGDMTESKNLQRLD
jgi:hypothetical protein